MRKPMRRAPPAMSLNMNSKQISRRTSITVSCLQGHYEDHSSYSPPSPPWWDSDPGHGFATCNGRTRTVITAGVLPKSPWLP